MNAKKLQVAVLSAAMLLPAGSAFAQHSRTRGAVVGAIAGALIGKGPRSAVVGAAVGNGVQYVRNRQEKKKEVRHIASAHRRHHKRHSTR